MLRERDLLSSKGSDFIVLSRVNYGADCVWVFVITLAKRLGDPPLVMCKCTPLPPGRSADPGAVLCSLSVFDGKWLRWQERSLCA